MLGNHFIIVRIVSQGPCMHSMTIYWFKMLRRSPPSYWYWSGVVSWHRLAACLLKNWVAFSAVCILVWKMVIHPPHDGWAFVLLLSYVLNPIIVYLLLRKSLDVNFLLLLFIVVVLRWFFPIEIFMSVFVQLLYIFQNLIMGLVWSLKRIV